jgi:hypothetical protein
MALGLVAGIAAGWLPSPDATPAGYGAHHGASDEAGYGAGGPDAARTDRDDATANLPAGDDVGGAFPLAGRWRFADSGGLLPRRSGCAAGDAALELSAHALTLTRGAWRQTVFAIADWRLKGVADLELQLAGSGSPLTDRTRVTLDLSSAGFVRFRSATTADGVPLARLVARLPEPRRAAARAELDQIAGALTLLRCPDPALDTAALLRGPVAASKPQWVLR